MKLQKLSKILINYSKAFYSFMKVLFSINIVISHRNIKTGRNFQIQSVNVKIGSSSRFCKLMPLMSDDFRIDFSET